MSLPTLPCVKLSGGDSTYKHITLIDEVFTMFDTWEVLPLWLYLMALLSASRTLQCYTPSLSRRLLGILYSRVPFHQERTSAGLAARQFGSWHLLSAAVQIHAGMCIHEPGPYNVGALSSVIILLHFLWERLGERTLEGRSFLAAEGLAFVGFCWMMVQRDVYLNPQAVPGGRGSAPLHHPWEGGPYIPGPH